MIFSFLMGRRDPQHGGPSLFGMKQRRPRIGDGAQDVDKVNRLTER